MDSSRFLMDSLCLMLLDHLRIIVGFVLDLPMMSDSDVGSMCHDG